MSAKVNIPVPTDCWECPLIKICDNAVCAAIINGVKCLDIGRPNGCLFVDEDKKEDTIPMREWNLLRNSIQELQENNPEKKDIQFVTKFLLRLMDISERREFNNEM